MILILPFIEIFGHKIALYGTLIMLGGALGIMVAAFRKNHYSIKRDDIVFSSFYGGIGVLIGAKLLFIIISLPEIVNNWAVYTSSLKNFLTIVQGGFVFYGGLIGALIGIRIYTKSYKINTFEMFEVLVPSIPLIHAFGRIGCFCAGCCYGKPFPPPIGVRFIASPLAIHNVTLFPIQLLESGLNFIIFIFLIILSHKKRKIGTILGSYLVCYSVIRFILEYFRYDYVRGFLLGISTSQWISLMILPIGLALIILPVKKFKFFQSHAE